VFVRCDLTAPQITVQACHAVLEATKAYASTEHPNIVLLGVDNEWQLHAIGNRLQLNDISFRCFSEPDLNDQMTAIATAPVYGAARKIFARYQLLKESDYVRTANV
jgi:hypothetical protein